MRRPLYYCVYWLRYWPMLIFAPFRRLILKGTTQKTVDGIEIVDASQRRAVDQSYREDTAAALDLIKSVDQRRFRRIQREIKQLINVESLRIISYQRPGKICLVDYSRLTDTTAYGDHREWYLWWYATALVHEATHGAIHTRGIFYTKSLRARIERLCHTEQKRFSKKADVGERQWSAALVGPFDERNWHPWWFMTIREAYKQVVARQQQTRQSLTQETISQNRK